MAAMEDLKICFCKEDEEVDHIHICPSGSGDSYTVHCSSFVLGDESDVKRNAANNVLVRGLPFFTRVEYCDVETKEVFVSGYHRNLQEVLVENKYAIFDEDGDATRYGHDIIEKLFNAFSKLYEEGISFQDSAVENIVFLKSDTECRSPHLLTLHFSDFRGRKSTFKALGVLIGNTNQGRSKLAVWWRDFINALSGANVDIRKLQRHPMFWRAWDTKDFILRVRDIIKVKAEEFKVEFRQWFYRQRECKNWTIDIQNDVNLKEFYAESVEKYNSKYDNDAISLVRFLRNFFTDYNDRAVRAQYLALQFGGVASTTTVQTGDVSWMEDYVWKLYPSFILRLFNVMWERVINDGLEKNFEWSPHSVLRGSKILPC